MDIEKYEKEVESLNSTKEYYKSIQFDIIADKFDKAATMMQELIDTVSSCITKEQENICEN